MPGGIIKGIIVCPARVCRCHGVVNQILYEWFLVIHRRFSTFLTNSIVGGRCRGARGRRRFPAPRADRNVPARSGAEARTATSPAGACGWLQVVFGVKLLAALVLLRPRVEQAQKLGALGRLRVVQKRQQTRTCVLEAHDGARGSIPSARRVYEHYYTPSYTDELLVPAGAGKLASGGTLKTIPHPKIQKVMQQIETLKETRRSPEPLDTR